MIDKAGGKTSFDVVREVKKLFNMRRVGHSGTLDPLATGLLILALGQGTKLLEYLLGMDKVYEVKAIFGSVSDTYDAEGEISVVDEEAIFTERDIEKTIEENFLGKIEQLPPKYSALKVKGKKACDIMREGGDVELKPRKVNIYGFEITDFNWPIVDFRVFCGSGTYIRSLVHDLGQKLGCGAYVKELRRTSIGDFSVDDAVSVDDLIKKSDQKVLDLEAFAGKFKNISLNDQEFEVLSHGGVLKNKKVEQKEPVMAFYKDKFVGILENAKSIDGIKFRKMIVA